MKKFLVALVLLGTSLFSNAEIVTLPIPGAPGLSITVGTGVNALPLRDVRNITGATNVTMGDDEVRQIPLGFDFPFWGRTFNESWMSSNGFVAFQPNLGNGCCSGVDLTSTINSAYNYTIFGVHSDLYAHPGVGSNWYLRETNTMTYGWYNVSQCCDANGGNSFEIKINSSGVVDTRIAGAMVNWNAVTSGMSGDLSRGEYFQAYHGQGINIPMGSGGLSWNTSGGFTGSDPCLSNPLSSPSCPGYAAAYFTQQCTISALYDPSCTGYAVANFTLQCSLNPLYNEQCTGYADAYLTQQCSINPLYSNRCSGYQEAYFNQQCDANQLYDTRCPGYASAYLELQCSQNPLYSTTCQGYEQAYFNQQCSISPLYNSRCSGYAEAYRTQQCGLNPLYSTTCSGYARAYHDQQCSVNPLFATDCLGYAQAYFNQQCSLNGLYDQRCPNYAEAYAKKMLLEKQGLASTVATAGVVAQTAEAANANTSSNSTSDGSSSVAVAVVADPIVNAAVTSTSTSATSTTAAVPLVTNTNTGVSSVTTTSVSTTSTPTPSAAETKPSAPTARQQLQERRAQAARTEAVEKGKNLAKEIGKASDIESQKQVQNIVMQAMGFTPGFDVYNNMFIQDSHGYKPFTIYVKQNNVDNARLNRRLNNASDILHTMMIEMQWEMK